MIIIHILLKFFNIIDLIIDSISCFLHLSVHVIHIPIQLLMVGAVPVDKAKKN